MRIKFTFLALLSIINISVFSQGWTLQKPFPTEFNVVSVDFPSADTGYLCTSDQTFRTIDGGLSWMLLEVPAVEFTDDFRQVLFLDNNKGFVLSVRGCFRTTNAGETWQFITITNDAYFKSIFFLNDTTGYACGSRQTVARTNDGGLTWTLLCGPNGYSNSVYGKIQFVDTITGYVISENGGQSVMLETGDGGYSWDLYDLDNEIEDPSCFQALSANEMWVGTMETYTYYHKLGAWHTINGGYSWVFTEMDLNTTWGLSDIEFNGLSGWALTSRDFYTSEDGGITWNGTFMGDLYPGRIRLLDFDRPDSFTGVMIGEGPAIIKTTDGGTTFTNLVEGSIPWYHSIFFSDTLKGFAAGSMPGSVIDYTLDGGKHWTPSSLDTIYTYIWDMQFGSPQVGYATNDSGFYKTIDGGMHWTSHSTGTDVGYLHISVIDENILFFMGIQSGAINIIKSLDGGDTWTDISPGITGYFNPRMVFVDSLTGYLAFESWDGNPLFKTNDGGESWTQLNHEFPTNIVAMDFYDSLTGFVSYYDEIWSTRDGGLTWIKCSFPDPFWATYITILDDQTVLAASSILEVAVSYNNGQSFITTYSNAQNIASLWDHHFLNDRCGWICGSNGMIRHYGRVETGLPNPELKASADPFFYPNPSHSTITIKDPSAPTFIYTCDGRIVYFQGGGASNIINVSCMKPGVYVVKSGKKIGKLVVGR